MTVGKVGGGKIWYYDKLGRKDDHNYYAGEERNELEPDGCFIGTGAERIGLDGKAVENKVFRNLMRGFDPTGKEAWVQNAGKFNGTDRDRMPGWDITFSAPKSVSIAAALGGDETRRQIEEAHFEAIKETIKDLEKKCIVRSGKAGCIKENGGFIAAVFQHGTARQVDKNTPPDMQLHSHAVVVNTAITERLKKGAVNGLKLLEKGTHHEYGAAYRARLSQKLNKLGFQTVPTKDGFELAAIPAEVINHFSKRGNQISQQTPRDKSTAKEKLRANLKTRVAKTDLNPKNLLLYWKERALSFGLTPARIDAARKQQDTRTTDQRWKQALAVTEAAADLLAKSQTTFTKKELRLAAIKAGAGSGLTVAEMEKATGAFITGKTVLRLEMKRDEKGAGTERMYSTKANQEAITRKTKLEQASDQLAGENLRNLKRTLEKQGFRVMGCAVKKDAVDKMEKAGVKSFTVAKLLNDEERRTAKQKDKPEPFKESVTEAAKKAAIETYANFNWAVGRWSKKRRDFVIGKEEKPSSEWMHAFKRATGQINEQEQKHLDAELGPTGGYVR